MATIHVEPSDNIQDILSIELDQTDFKGELDQELKTIRKKATIKGFRPGSAPVNYVRKVYGRDTLVRVITKLMDEKLKEFLKENDKKYILEPVLRNDSEMPFENINAEKFIIKFDLGKNPEFELKGLENEFTLTRLLPEVTEEEVETEIVHLRKTMGVMAYPEDNFKEEDILDLWIREMDEAGENVLDNGYEITIKISPQDVKHEAFKADLLGLKVGDKIHFEYKNLSDKDEDFIKKYILKMEDDSPINNHFEGMVEEVSRHEPAELNEDFYTKVFGPDVEIDSEDAFKERIKKQIQDFEGNAYNQFIVDDFKAKMIDLNPVELPEEFFKNYITAKSEEVMADEEVEHSLIHMKEDMHWNLVLTKIIDAWGIKINEEDINEQFRVMVRRYMGGQYIPQVEDNFVQKSWENEEMVQQASNRALSNKFVVALLEKMPLDLQILPKEEFAAKLQTRKEAAEAKEHDHSHHTHHHDHEESAELPEASESEDTDVEVADEK